MFSLVYLKKNITQDIAPYVLRMTYTDNIKGESDTVEIELEDTDGKWENQWYPGKGDTVILKMGYLGEPLLDCGTFSIDEIESRGPPSTISIKGVATSVNTALRTKSNRGFENTTLGAIASRIAKKHKLKLVGSIEPIKLDRVTQNNETDVAFLKRLGKEYGYAVKVTATQLIFSHLDTLRSLPSAMTLARTDISSYSLRDTINRVYKSAKLKHQKASDKKLVVYEADGSVSQSTQTAKTATHADTTSADTLKVNGRASSSDTAERKATAALNAHNEYQEQGQITLMGMAGLVAGNKVTLTGFGKFSGDWLLNAVRHTMTRSNGYVTEMEIVRGPLTKGTKKKKKTTTLTVYHPDGTTSTTVKEQK
ncbi:contractile injection system protein, VgrG/Pvc8 family [Prodigiosinella aquatilis]|nr:contractile injection system protein, VgrG/Pvc8 family [Prodigiosinella sp. LS101]WJV56112.1 contractile injection system protein, VgrG/Pvc8 family [Prodigiosinella sp. LS101]WJV60479.1 contractile injection system protein, VgrG/Pvc8 family [Pectobacteriaceae bacterium C111]